MHGFEMVFELRGEGPPLLLLHGFSGNASDWAHAGREQLEQHFRLIVPNARGHGRSTNPAGSLTHRQCAQDSLALLDHLDIECCQAIGMSMGGNTLLHMATLQPDRLSAMILVSATPYFPAQARAVMRATPSEQPPAAWATMRSRHTHGDDQIRALWQHQRGFADSYDDMNFTPPSLARIKAHTLIVHGDSDPLYPVDVVLEMYHAIPRSNLWVVPGGGHVPILADAAKPFLRTALEFLNRESRNR